MLSTLFDIYLLWRTLKKVRQTKAIDIVHCRSYITSLIGLQAKRKWKIPFIFDMRGFWADERVEGKIWNLKNPLFKLVYAYFKKKEKEFLFHSDYTITLTHEAKKYIHNELNLPISISVIPTCVDLEKFNPTSIHKEKVDKIRHELGLKEDTFLVVYLGSLGTWYLSELIWKYFHGLNEKYASAHLLLLTQDAVTIPDFINSEKVTVQTVPHTAIPAYLNLANVGLCFILPTFSKRASSATKIQEFIAMGVPVITNKGWGDVSLVSEEIHETIENKGQVYELVKITDKTLNLAYFSLAYGIKQYANVYVQVLKIS